MESPMSKKRIIWNEIQLDTIIIIGAIIAAAALEFFLVPNNILDGGVIGLSIIASKLTGTPTGLFIIVLSIPFLIIGYKKIGLRFTLRTLLGVVVLSATSSYFHQFERFTDDLFLATIIGAVILGIGVGLVIRTGGALDGTEIIAIIVNKKRPISVGRTVMIINIFIFVLAALLAFSWETALYSIITYFIASKTMDIVVEGVEEMKEVTIVSDNYEEISKALIEKLDRGLTYLHGEGVYSGEQKKIIYTIISRIELYELRSTVKKLDPKALIAIGNIADVLGGNFNDKKGK